MLFERLIVHHDRSDRSAALNMAIEEALLEQANLPTLRLYHWDHPAISFGYFGKFDALTEAMRACDVVRRWTGGGIVPHGEDLTYSVVTPMNNAAAALSPPAIYKALHSAIRAALEHTGRKAELAGESAPKISETCFANPVRHDLLADGRKIAGAAQRRTRSGFLHQGSIQLPDLSASFRARFAAALAPQIDEMQIPTGILQRASQLAVEKYGTQKWLHRR